MSLLGKLGLVNETAKEEVEPVQEPVEQKKQSAVRNVVPATVRKSTLSFAPPTANLSGKIVGQIDNDIFDKLSVAIEENNLDGNDFLEFMQSVNKMSAVVMDESTKFNAIFATLTTSSGGMTKEHLVESISHYISVLENEKKIFTNEMSSAYSEMVTKKEEYSEQLTKTAQDKAEQINKLTQEIQEINETISTSNAEAEQAKVSIAQKQANFDVTVQQLEGQISDYKTKIEKYIK